MPRRLDQKIWSGKWTSIDRNEERERPRNIAKIIAMLGEDKQESYPELTHQSVTVTPSPPDSVGLCVWSLSLYHQDIETQQPPEVHVSWKESFLVPLIHSTTAEPKCLVGFTECATIGMKRERAGEEDCWFQKGEDMQRSNHEFTIDEKSESEFTDVCNTVKKDIMNSCSYNPIAKSMQPS